MSSSRRPVALVTGSARLNGIGFSVCRQLAKSAAGYHVVLTARDINAGQAALKELKAGGIEHCSLVQLDVSSPASCAGAVAEAERLAGAPPCCLVNNSGVATQRGALDLSLEEFDQIFDVNVKGTIRLTQACLPALRRSTETAPRDAKTARLADWHHPTIVNVSSILASLAENSDPNSVAVRSFRSTAYNMSKAALNMWTVNLACELSAGPEPKIAVNAVHPGFIATEMTANFKGAKPQYDNEWGAQHIVDTVLAHKKGRGPSGAFLHNKLSLRW